MFTKITTTSLDIHREFFSQFIVFQCTSINIHIYVGCESLIIQNFFLHGEETLLGTVYSVALILRRKIRSVVCVYVC